MKKQILYIMLVIGAVSCSEKSVVESPEEESHLEFKTQIPQEDSVFSVLKCTGVVDVPPQSRATVSAPLGGYLREVRFYPGEHVNKGQELARIAHPEYINLQKSYLDAKARSEFTKADYERKMALHLSNAVNDRTVEAVKAEYEVQKSTMMAAAASLRQMGINPELLTPETIQSELILCSPISGHITRIDGNLGQHVTPEMPIYEIVDDSHMHIELSVFPRDIHQVEMGQTIHFSLPGDHHVYAGEVKQVGRQVRPESGAFVVHAHAEDGVESLRPGQFVEGTITTQSHIGLVVPSQAIVTEGEFSYVFVEHDGHYEKTKVEIGIEMPDQVEILTILKEPVVVENAHLLQEANGGHEH